ncbi:MAG: OmpA family protein [bacterium]|nr:OmpA family protein [bacterium]
MRARLPLPVLALLFLFTLSAATPAAAQFGKLKDKVKSKVERKVDQKTDQAIDKTIDGAVDGVGKDGEAPAPADPAEPAAPGADGDKAAAPAAGGTAVAEDMTLYTKYDFVPGDKVIFYDDLAKEELGEFPSRWNLDHGVFEIAKAEGRNWILCTDKGIISPKVARGPLPEKYTVEMEFFSNADQDGWYTIHWVDAAGQRVGELRLGYSYMTRVVINDKELASKEVPKLPPGATSCASWPRSRRSSAISTRSASPTFPRVADFAPVGFLIEMDPYFENTGISRIGTFRYAEGGKSLREQLDESGRIVTHGILFDSGSDRIKAESYKTLTDIGTMLAEDASLRLSIEGHTDADGADDANLKLSQARAAAVRAYLGQKHGIDGGRLETKGLGEGKPIDTNDTPEGKANNRRVELVKL